MCAESQTLEYLKSGFDGLDDERRSLEHRKESVTKCVSIGARWRNLVHAYIQVNIGICLHLHTSPETSDGERRDLAFVIQKSGASNVDAGESSSSGANDLRIGIRRPRSNDVQPPVPVYSRPVRHNSKGAIDVVNQVFWRKIRHIVRLYRLDDVPTLLCEWRSIEGAILSTTLADGKFEFIFIGGRIFPRLSNSRSIDARIESSAQLVKHFSKFERDSIGEISSKVRLEPDAPCPVVVHAYANGVEVFFLTALIPQIADCFAVSLCAANTLPTALEFEKRHGLKYNRFG
jgi:hypothetical protein